MIHWFSYKGKRSDDFGLYIQKKNSYDSPSRDISFQSVPGRNGDIIIDNGRYKNIDLTYTVAIVSRGFLCCINDIKNWLVPEISYFKLFDSYDDNYYRMATLSGGLPVEQQLANLGKCDVKFNCKPLRCSFFGDRTITVNEQGTSIFNRECYTSLPYMRIFGNGNITLYVNDTAFYFYEVDEYVETDSDMMNCFKGTTNLNNKMRSDSFPIFKPGKNIISWTGNVSKIELNPRWRTI